MTRENKGLGKQLLHPLTSLRFFAALAIFLQHSGEALRLPFQHLTPVPFNFGVDFFFILSGFILSYVHADIGTTYSKKSFYVARIARIWPLHIVTLLLWLAVVPQPSWLIAGAESYVIETTLANIFLLQAWVPIFFVYFSFNSVSWSISTEAFFYLLFPWLAINWRRTWYWKFALVVMGVLAILMICDAFHIPPLSGTGDLSSITIHGIVYISPFVRIFEFVLGMCSALLFRRISPTVQRIPPFLLTLLEILAIVLMPSIWRFSQSLSNDLFRSSETAVGFFANSVPMALLFAVMIVVYAVGKGLISRLLSWRPLILLGEASFALYMVHQILLNPLQTYRNELESIPVLTQFWGALVFSIAIAFVLYRWVEIPSRRFIVNRFGRDKKAI